MTAPTNASADNGQTPSPLFDNTLVRIIAGLATVASIVVPNVDPHAIQGTASALISISGGLGALISAIGLFRHGQRAGSGN